MLILLAKMLHILVLCPVLLIGGVQTLTIDSQLGTSIEDCFERISIGEQLPNSAIYRNVSELTTRECEQICKQDKQCQAYDYGVGAKGNATCDLSTRSEKEVKEKSILTRHPDYDVYVRRFQCEQSPPKPIQPLLDDPEDGGPNSNVRPIHRPVFRPDMDERPLTGDYLVSSDIDPYNLGSKPQSYRPDDISQKPTYDDGPSYGDHQPQNIPYPEKPNPYRPERPQDPYGPTRPDQYRPTRPNDQFRPERPDPYNPQDSYKPNRPEQPHDTYRPQSYPLQKPKPDSHDVLNFESYSKPRPGYPTNNPDTHRPEKPNYNYIIHPNRKPRPEDEYMKPTRPTDTSNQYGHHSGPIGPTYKPQRPEKPIYNYNNQYASGYGQNSQNDNSVYVEIYDPPRPYIPIKDRPVQHYYDQGFLGYGTYSSQNSYMQSGSYTGSITEIGYDQDRPNLRPQKPYGQSDDRPGYGNKPSSGPHSGTGQSYDHDYISLNGYGSYGFDGDKRPVDHGQNGHKRPNDRYKPQNSQNSHGGNQNPYGGDQNSYGSNQGSYGSSHSDQSQSNYGSYGESNRPSYNQDNGDSGYQKPQKPSYNKPSYNADKGDYGNQGSYGGSQSSYGSNQDSYEGNHGYHNSNKGTQSNYGSVQSSYGSTQESYGQNLYSQSSHGSQNYGSQSYGLQGSYGSSQSHGSYYGGNKGSYNSNQGSYGSNQGSYGSNQGSGSYDAYGSHGGYGNRPVFDYETHKPGYGNEKPYDSPKPGYGNPKPDYDTPKPGYGGQTTNYDTPKPGYGNQKPDYDTPKPGYGGQTTNYDTPKPGYGNQKPDYDTPKPGYGGQTPNYDSPKPGYGNQKPDYDTPKPAYGGQTSNYDTPEVGYGNPKPDYDTPKPGYGGQTSGYDTPKPGYGGQTSGYDTPKPGYGNLKPDYDTSKPGYGNDRPDPVYTKPDNQRPGYGNGKPDDTGYGSQNSDRPDVKPVYEYEMDKPTNVPTYLSRPGGEVVTSRPVVIGDYERPGYKEPGMSYAGHVR